MIDVTIFERARETVAGLPSSSSAATSGHEVCLPRKDFEDLFTKVILNGKTYIQANYGLYSVGSLSGYGLMESSGSSGGGTVTIEQVLTSGTLIATINGVSIYAPTASSVSVSQILTAGTAIAEINGVTLYAPTASSGGGGASSWDELTGKPAWLTPTAPGVSTFANDAGYVLSSALGALAALSTVGTGQIAKYAVTQDKIAGGAVTAYQLANAAVQTAKIADGAVTAAKLEHSGMTLWGGEVSLGEARDGNILLGSGMGVRFTDGEKTAWLRYDSANNALYVADSNGNAVNLYATGGLSGFGFVESSGGSGSGSGTVEISQALTSGTLIATINGVSLYAPTPASVSVSQILTSGTAIAEINGVTLYAPTASSGGGGGGASSWDELTGKPAWLTPTAPGVSTFANDAGYITAAGQLWQDNGGTYQITGVDTLRFDDADVYMSGVVEIQGSLDVTGNSTFYNSVYIGSSGYNSAKYLWFAYRGIFFEGEGTTSGNPWYGTLCTHDAYVQKSINMRCFNPYTVIPQLAVGSGYLDGTRVPSYTMSVNGQSYVNGSSIVDGYTRVSSYLETSTAYAETYVLKPFANSGSQDGSGNIVTPSWKSRITMTDDYSGMISLACGGVDYFSMNAAEGVIRSLRELYITNDNGLRIGNAYLRWDAANNALYVTGAGGAQVNFYATGGLSGYSALGTFDTLTNLNITGQLSAGSVATSGINSVGDLVIDAKGDNVYLNGRAAYVDGDGYIHANEVHISDRLRVGGTTATYDITGVYADGSYVYVTINGKRYRLTPSATTTV